MSRHIPSSVCATSNGHQNAQLTCHKDDTGLELLPETLPGLLRFRASITPNALAIESYICNWTYAQLERTVSATAKILGDRGIRPGDNVGICFHLSPWAVVSILANMRLGAAVVPVDPLHPSARRATMLREAGVRKVLVEDSSYAEDVMNSGFSVVDISALEVTSGLDKRARPLNMEPDPRDKAFVAFTSGSTGTPKGIIQTHQGIVTMCRALANRLRVTASSRVAQFHPYIFDVALTEIGMCLDTGATLCISKRKDMMLPFPGELGLQLTGFKITHVTMSPTMLETMDPGDVPTVEVLSVMGESLGRHAVEKWASTASRTFYQLWGCTEATILQSITTAITATHAPRDVGQAIGDTCRLWIADPADVNKLMTEGAAGELVVESRALAKGYINQPEETLRNFVERADWMDVASRGTLYKTGDLGQKEADGSITFLGRLDSQMNYHGERVELGEINFHLERGRPPGVSACFSDFDVSSQTVIGFVCTADPEERQPQELVLPWSRAGVSRCAMEHLSRDLVRRGDLPPYMVPHLWIPICQRPLTISGKTDRTRLRQIVRNLSTKQRDEYSVRSGVVQSAVIDTEREANNRVLSSCI